MHSYKWGVKAELRSPLVSRGHVQTLEQYQTKGGDVAIHVQTNGQGSLDQFVKLDGQIQKEGHGDAGIIVQMQKSRRDRETGRGVEPSSQEMGISR
jgi:hypothetical protein